MQTVMPSSAKNQYPHPRRRIMFQGLFGNSTEINAKELQKDLDATMVEGETVVKAFKIVRDLFVFTDKRLLLIDKQGLTGKKAEYHSIPYKSISRFSVETAGTFDMDAEMKIYISGNPTPIRREFKRGTDIVGVQKVLAGFILK
jgi:Bacterial PH domain